MHLYSIFCNFATLFVLVQCNYHTPRKTIDHIFAKKIDCRMVRNSVIGTMMNSTCKPHYRHVSLESKPSEKYNPSVVSVKRCSGNCPGLSCVPVKKRIIQVPVKMTSNYRKSNQNAMCALVEVEEHTHCRCMCMYDKSDCNEKQYYIENGCACVCINRELEKLKCESDPEMIWDDTDCSCNKYATKFFV